MYYFSGKCFLKFVLINKWLLIIIGQKSAKMQNKTFGKPKNLIQMSCLN
jgi:hypothetical protein